MSIKKTLQKAAKKIMDKAMGYDLSQDFTRPEGERYITPGMPALARQAVAESLVLLKNDGMLPLRSGETVAVFGRCQFDCFYVGYGSGGDVHAPYTVSPVDGFRAAGIRMNELVLGAYMNWTSLEENRPDQGFWGHWPMNYPEMPVTEELARQAAETSDAAIVILGRAAGEDRENTLTKGSFYLTDEERALLDTVTASFEHVAVLMNIGNVIDFAWTEEYGDKISALMIIWQGGMESGNGLADVLTGRVSPCGKLADSIARRYEDYPSSANFGGKDYNSYEEDIYVGYRYFDRHPEEVLFPFGFGLSYTTFLTEAVSLCREGDTTAVVRVTNTGSVPGKEVVPAWVSAPTGRLDKPERVLAAFAKTHVLEPGESEELTLVWDDKCMASFDEETHRFILEPGEYRICAGETLLGIFTLDKEETVEQCESLCPSVAALRARILERLPKAAEIKRLCFDLDEVRSGQATLDQFLAGLTPEELEALSRGHGMMGSSFGTPGNAGAFGGIIPSLQDKNVPAIITADGPAGLRLQCYCSLLPCGTALACTWNTALVRQLAEKVGDEMVYYGIDVHLAPGMNLHRNPLCGRNFEYYSEDPLLSGKMAAAFVSGVQSRGKASCPKHFACNNQEVNRNQNDSRLSERALREIYLRNFEICVREAKPLVIMTSYNKVNGVWSHYNYDLVTTVLRGDWGYTGCVITDWWMRRSKSPEFPQIEDNAYRVRAQVDVLMPGDMGRMAKQYKSNGTLLPTLGQPEGITRGELERTARNVLTLALRLEEAED